MTDTWIATDTTTHQDHVIAHVRGTTVLGYFILDEALYFLLDIGFIWTIYVDGQMELLSQGLIIEGLDIDDERKRQLLAEIDLLHEHGPDAQDLMDIIPVAAECRIKDVIFYIDGERRRLLITGEVKSLAVGTSLNTAEIQVYEM